jgi:hypothetical protein
MQQTEILASGTLERQYNEPSNHGTNEKKPTKRDEEIRDAFSETAVPRKRSHGQKITRCTTTNVQRSGETGAQSTETANETTKTDTDLRLEIHRPDTTNRFRCPEIYALHGCRAQKKTKITQKTKTRSMFVSANIADESKNHNPVRLLGLTQIAIIN